MEEVMVGLESLAEHLDNNGLDISAEKCRAMRLRIAAARADAAELAKLLRQTVKMEEDAHPGLVSWCELRREIHQQSRAALARHAAFK